MPVTSMAMSHSNAITLLDLNKASSLDPITIPTAACLEQRSQMCDRKTLSHEPPHPQAALDVFVTEPPPADNPLVGRDDVICTPHLGASTTEAQEDVSIEVAEVVVSALKVRGPSDTSRAARGWLWWV